jgi:predicted transcriptional regulator
MTERIFTPRELDVMSVLWELGSGTVAEVRERLTDELAYTTVLSVLQTLAEKGYVGHEEEGRAYRWHPAISRDTAGRGEVRRLVKKVFGGSPELLMAHLVDDQLDETELARLRALIDERLEGDGSRAAADGEGG